MQKYINLSIELHLFFARIMKEHAIFLEAGFPSKDNDFIRKSEWYKREFEQLLLDTISISEGAIRPKILTSGEIVTEYTLSTEIKTEELTNIVINKDITLMERNLKPINDGGFHTSKEYMIRKINTRAVDLLNGLIEFKEKILNEVLSCKLFTSNYPLLIDHILREAKLYRYYVISLENGEDIENGDIKQIELFWNQIMMEHAAFIRGMLDPSESELINTSNNFENEYKELLKEAATMTDATMESVKNKTLWETVKYRDFKIAGTKGLDSCKIKSVILPLLADHVLREANHYLRILKD